MFFGTAEAVSFQNMNGWNTKIRCALQMRKSQLFYTNELGLEPFSCLLPQLLHL